MLYINSISQYHSDGVIVVEILHRYFYGSFAEFLRLTTSQSIQAKHHWVEFPLLCTLFLIKTRVRSIIYISGKHDSF